MKVIRFECSRCNRCCGGQPGYVWLSRADVISMSNYLAISIQDFIRSYCRFVDVGIQVTLSLKEKDPFDCIFLSSEGCQIYEARPIQCRTYPFWEAIIANESSWNAESKECPGIGKGSIVQPQKIAEAIALRRQNPPIDSKDIEDLMRLCNDWKS